MIKIIKRGSDKFTAVCRRCGCEFEYELEDMMGNDRVLCPECGDAILHRRKSGEENKLWKPCDRLLEDWAQWVRPR